MAWSSDERRLGNCETEWSVGRRWEGRMIGVPFVRDAGAHRARSRSRRAGPGG